MEATLPDTRNRICYLAGTKRVISLFHSSFYSSFSHRETILLRGGGVKVYEVSVFEVSPILLIISRTLEISCSAVLFRPCLRWYSFGRSSQSPHWGVRKPTICFSYPKEIESLKFWLLPRWWQLGDGPVPSNGHFEISGCDPRYIYQPPPPP